MKRRIATERLSKIYIARCGYTWLYESKWPQEWPISPITIIYLKIPSEKMKSFCLHKTGFLSLDIQRFLHNKKLEDLNIMPEGNGSRNSVTTPPPSNIDGFF